jgi:hypothetical protein
VHTNGLCRRRSSLNTPPTSLKIIFAHPHRGAVPVQRGGGPVGSIEPTAAPNHPNHRVLLFGKVSRLGASQGRVPVLDPHQFCDSIVTLEPTRISVVDSFLIAHPLPSGDLINTSIPHAPLRPGIRRRIYQHQDIHELQET